MVARPSAFFHPDVERVAHARAARLDGEIDDGVVPPNAAARVPVSKSSLDVVPPKGMSRCVWASMPPGITYMPVASITRESAGAQASGRLPDALAFDQHVGLARFGAVTTVPLRIRVFMESSLSVCGVHLRRMFPRD